MAEQQIDYAALAAEHGGAARADTPPPPTGTWEDRGIGGQVRHPANPVAAERAAFGSVGADAARADDAAAARRADQLRDRHTAGAGRPEAYDRRDGRSVRRTSRIWSRRSSTSSRASESAICSTTSRGICTQ